MMKTTKPARTHGTLLSFLLLGLVFFCTQAWAWPVGGGGALNDQANDMVVGPSGNVYIVGSFRGLAGMGTHTINAQGILESFLPIRPGDRLVGTMWVHEKFQKRGKNFLVWRMEVRNEAGEMVARKFWRSYWTDREIEFPKPESYN